MLKVSDGGKVYYQNSKLKCTQWERPQREVSRDTDTDTHKTDAVTQMESTTCDTSSSGRGAGGEACKFVEVEVEVESSASDVEAGHVTSLTRNVKTYISTSVRQFTPLCLNVEGVCLYKK